MADTKKKTFSGTAKDAKVLSLDEVKLLLGDEKFSALISKHEMYKIGRPVNILTKLASAGRLEGIFPSSIDILLNGNRNSNEDAASDDEDGVENGYYEGELNKLGQPHGFGRKCSKDGTYTGEYSQGTRNGYGTLRDNDTGQALYSGFWSNGVKHGYGRLSDSFTEYTGYFDSGKRSGYGIARFMRDRLIGGKDLRAKGEQYAGFWKNDEINGVGRWIYPIGSARVLQNRRGNTANVRLAQFGELICLVVHENGRLKGDFFYHRRDGISLTLQDKKTLLGHRQYNDEPTQVDESDVEFRRKIEGELIFAPSHENSRIWPSCDVCWACKNSKGALFRCPECFLVVHQPCNNFRESCPLDNSPLHEFNSPKVGESYPGWKDISVRFAAAPRSRKASKNKIGSKVPKVKQTKKRKQLGKIAIRENKANQPHARKRRTAKEVEVDKGRRLAIRLGQLLCDIKIDAQANSFQDEIRSQRINEIKTRKRWKEEMGNQELQAGKLERSLQESQAELAKSERNALRLQGQGVEMMNLADLTSLQVQIESALTNCRQVLMGFTSQLDSRTIDDSRLS